MAFFLLFPPIFSNILLLSYILKYFNIIRDSITQHGKPFFLVTEAEELVYGKPKQESLDCVAFDKWRKEYPKHFDSFMGTNLSYRTNSDSFKYYHALCSVAPGLDVLSKSEIELDIQQSDSSSGNYMFVASGYGFMYFDWRFQSPCVKLWRGCSEILTLPVKVGESVDLGIKPALAEKLCTFGDKHVCAVCAFHHKPEANAGCDVQLMIINGFTMVNSRSFMEIMEMKPEMIPLTLPVFDRFGGAKGCCEFPFYSSLEHLFMSYVSLTGYVVDFIAYVRSEFSFKLFCVRFQYDAMNKRFNDVPEHAVKPNSLMFDPAVYNIFFVRNNAIGAVCVLVPKLGANAYKILFHKFDPSHVGRNIQLSVDLEGLYASPLLPMTLDVTGVVHMYDFYAFLVPNQGRMLILYERDHILEWRGIRDIPRQILLDNQHFVMGGELFFRETVAEKTKLTGLRLLPDGSDFMWKQFEYVMDEEGSFCKTDLRDAFHPRDADWRHMTVEFVMLPYEPTVLLIKYQEKVMLVASMMDGRAFSFSFAFRDFLARCPQKMLRSLRLLNLRDIVVDMYMNRALEVRFECDDGEMVHREHRMLSFLFKVIV